MPRTRLDKTLRALTVAAACLPVALAAHAQTTPSSTDAWDISQGAFVTGKSDVLVTLSPAGMFGDDAGAATFFPVERLNTLFVDLRPAGTVHSIDWQTPQPVSLSGFTLLAARDGNAPSSARGFSQFVLYAQEGGVMVIKQVLDTSSLYVGTVLDVTIDITPFTSSVFRAEFTQSGSTASSGPRILELDAISAVPEPGTWALMLAGAGLLALRCCNAWPRWCRARGCT